MQKAYAVIKNAVSRCEENFYLIQYRDPKITILKKVAENRDFIPKITKVLSVLFRVRFLNRFKTFENNNFHVDLTKFESYVNI